MGGDWLVSWDDSGARTGPHEIGLIAKIAAKNDNDAARRLYRKYRMELFRFGFHVLRDQGLAEEMVQETFIKFCRQAPNYDASRGPVRGWLFTIARSAAYDIARRPSSRPMLPVEDFQLPPQYDSVDDALTVLTVDQALDKLPSIYGDVMRLVRDGFTHSEIAGRLGIPVGTVKSRTAKAADTLRAELVSLRRAATMLSDRDIELAHPEAFDFAFGNLPAARRAEFNRHLAGCRYCQAVVDEYSEIGRIIKQLPPHVEPPADLEDRTVAAMVAALAEQRATGRRPDAEDEAATRAYPIPGRQPPGTGDPGPADSPVPAASGERNGTAPIARRPAGTGRAAGPAGGHPPAGMAALPGPPGRCRRRRRGRSSLAPSSSRSAFSEAGPPRSSRFMPPRRPR